MARLELCQFGNNFRQLTKIENFTKSLSPRLQFPKKIKWVRMMIAASQDAHPVSIVTHACIYEFFCILKFLLFSLSHLVPGYNFRFLQKLPRRCRLTAWLGLQLDDASICMNVYLSFNRPYLSWVYNLYILLSMPNSLR